MPEPTLTAGLNPSPLDETRFAALMAALGPFEARPGLAVAVSGGPDSLALCLLADRWARRRAGAVTGLIVDHGLRPQSAHEARQTAAWLTGRQIAWQILTWEGAKPAIAIQAAARSARYRLLGAWCRAAGVLHLLTAHHRDDQAETVALRQARASGPDGLAAMAVVRELIGLRLLRPLLGVPKAALLAVLEAEGQPWLDDPSNRAPGFARTRLRADPRLAPPRLARIACARGAARAAWDGRVAVWLAQHVRIFPAGFVLMAHAELAAAPGAIAGRALQQALLAVGGRPYPPRLARLGRLLDGLRADRPFAGRTLGGCRLLRRGDRLLICREPGAIEQVLEPEAGVWQSWDGRFAIRLTGAVAGLCVRALGTPDRRQRAGLKVAPAAALPAEVRPSLPAVWQGDRLLAVPALGLLAPDDAGRLEVLARFRPHRPLAGAPFAVLPA